ncbi:NAD(P)/FAD-dependent oxidoreductase [Streptomyces sp. NPDC059766]|uniref:NAD(P)/FAD-dependent oxidoreductase n=1 Tax=Streptomyces sp. NPDC059766 TaxID=3346940 RepID=UPI00364BCA26
MAPEAPVTSAPEDGPTDVDLAIVGAGPTGLYGAYYAGFRGLSTALVDALPEPGGQVASMYPEKLLYDIAAHPALTGRELVDNLVRQAAPFEPRYLLGETATTLVADGPRWILGTDRGARVRARARRGAPRRGQGPPPRRAPPPRAGGPPAPEPSSSPPGWARSPRAG